MSTPEPQSKIIGTKKLEAAERQLDTAIWLWFNDGDLISINTLAGAAHGVLDDLLQHRKKGRAFPFDTVPAGMSPRDWRNLVREGQAFAKHARTDPQGVQRYTVEEIEMFLFFVIVTYATLIGPDDDHELGTLFAVYFGVRNSRFAGSSFRLPQTLRHGNKEIDVKTLKKLSRTEFFQEFGGEFIGNPPSPD